jgi:hypothetical protein
MKIKASGRSALIATGLLICFAGPLPATAAGTDAAATSKSDGATAGKSVKQSSRHWKRYAHRKSSKVAAKSAETKKAAEPEIADADGITPAAIPASVANANAELTSADAPADSASAMSAKANTMLLAAADKPADAQGAPSSDVVPSDQLNDVDRALQQSTPSTQPSPPPAQTVAMSTPKAAPVLASSSDSSTWDQTSLIGKIFIGFGALLTMASAARMFMA